MAHRAATDGEPTTAGRSRLAVPDDRLQHKRLRVIGGIEIARFRFGPGESAYPALPGHLINVHLGRPTRCKTVRPDGEWAGTQVAGAVEVFAAGRATSSVLLDESEDVSLLLPTGVVGTVAAELGLASDRLAIADRLSGTDPQLETLVRLFAAELYSRGAGGELYADALGRAVALHLLRRYADVPVRPTTAGDTIGPNSRPERAIERAVEYIEVNLATELALATIAAAAGLSVRHLQRRFRAALGASPYQFVIQRRVERARVLLAEGDDSIAEVALAAGFAHQQHLARHFTRLVGTSPGRYRRLRSG